MKYAFKKFAYRISVPIFDVFGSIVSYPFKFFNQPMPPNPENILVIRLDHIGDFVCTTPIFKDLKKRYPGAQITVLVNSISKELADRDPNIDKVISFSPFWLARDKKSDHFKELMRIMKDIKNVGFDLGIDPRGDALSILIMWLGGVKHRVGYGITGGGFLLNKEVRYDRKIHVVDRNLALLRELDVPVEDKSPQVYFNEKDEDEVERLLRTFGARNDNFVVLHPFAGAASRGWAKNNFQNLIDKLKERGTTVFVIGTKNDDCSYSNIVDMRGKFSLPQLAYFIKRIGHFIGLNSGPANIAAALGVPSIIISSGTNIVEDWIPPSVNTRFVYKDIACRPCERKTCPKGSYECMDGITVEEVLEKLKEI